MKQFYTLLFFLTFVKITFGQVTPPNELEAYYSDVNFNTTGLDLFDELAVTTINKHTNFLSYSEAREALSITDLDPGSNTHVLLLYGFSNSTCETNTANDNDHRTRDKNSFGGGATCEWNREHTYAKSLGTPNLGTSGPGSDAHHLRASDVQRNGSRGSQKFNTGSGNSGDAGSGWYPGDEWKGDVARMMMYMYLRYGNQCLPSNVTIGTANSVDANMINLLLDWNAQDPVSTYEVNRNTYLSNTSNAYYQGNRNPFIDNPYLATLIWGGTTAQNTWGTTPTDNEAPSAPTNLMATNPTDNTIDLSWTAATDNTAVLAYDIYVDGVNTYTTTSTTFTANGLTTDTNYCFTIKAKDAAGNQSDFSNQACETTTNSGSGSGSVDLFFSEYIEGSGNNKVLEIANFTGANMTDLSMYTLKLSSNGSATWNTTYTFPTNAQINNQDVYVIANNGSTICTSVYDEVNTSITSFNGNDVIGLFKNDVLIDILGTLGDSVNFAKDVTLVRKEIIDAPNTTFIITEWHSFDSNTCTDLGSHTQTLSVDTFGVESFNIYPNPVENTLNINLKNPRDTQIDIYNVLGKKVLSQIITKSNNTINTQPLSNGMYIIRIQQDQSIISKKLIKR